MSFTWLMELYCACDSVLMFTLVAGFSLINVQNSCSVS